MIKVFNIGNGDPKEVSKNLSEELNNAVENIYTYDNFFVGETNQNSYLICNVNDPQPQEAAEESPDKPRPNKEVIEAIVINIPIGDLPASIDRKEIFKNSTLENGRDLYVSVISNNRMLLISIGIKKPIELNTEPTIKVIPAPELEPEEERE